MYVCMYVYIYIYILYITCIYTNHWASGQILHKKCYSVKKNAEQKIQKLPTVLIFCLAFNPLLENCVSTQGKVSLCFLILERNSIVMLVKKCLSSASSHEFCTSMFLHSATRSSHHPMTQCQTIEQKPQLHPATTPKLEWSKYDNKNSKLKRTNPDSSTKQPHPTHQHNLVAGLP